MRLLHEQPGWTYSALTNRSGTAIIMHIYEAISIDKDMYLPRRMDQREETRLKFPSMTLANIPLL